MVSTPGDISGREEAHLCSVFGDGVRFVDVSSRMAGTGDGARVGRGYQSMGALQQIRKCLTRVEIFSTRLNLPTYLPNQCSNF